MTGREEREEKLRVKIEKKLTDKPQYLRDWYNYLLSQDISETSCNDYLNKIVRFLSSIDDDLSNVVLEQITFQEVVNYMASKNHLGARKSSDSYKQCIWSALNNFFTFCCKNGLMKTNYMSDIKRSGNKDLARIKANRIQMTKDNYKEIIDNVKTGVGTYKAKKIQDEMVNRNLLIFLLLMTTGMRKGALCQINLEDIDTQDHVLIVTDKGDVTSKYILGDETMKYLNRWLVDREKYQTENSALFVTNRGNRISDSGIDKIMDKYGSSVLGKHMSAHKLRSGFCSIGYEETGNIEFVRRAVGHSNISTTQRYITTKNDERETATKFMNSIFA